LHIVEAEIHQIRKIQSPKIAKNDSLRISTFCKILQRFGGLCIIAHSNRNIKIHLLKCQKRPISPLENKEEEEEKFQFANFDLKDPVEAIEEDEEWIDIPSPTSDKVICFHENCVKIVNKMDLKTLFPGKEIPTEIFQKKICRDCPLHYFM